MPPEPEQPPVTPLLNAGLFFGRPLYRLDRDWTFTVMLANPGLADPTRTFTIPAGYKFDGASVPRLFWGFPFGYTPDGIHRAAALEHDFLCDLGQPSTTFLHWFLSTGLQLPARLSYQDTHAHFARRLTHLGLRPSQAWTMSIAVRWFGPRWKT